MAAKADGPPGAIALAPCPICGAAARERVKPFCSARCADIDLGRWLTGAYAIPAAEDEDEADEPSDGRR